MDLAPHSNEKTKQPIRTTKDGWLNPNAIPNAKGFLNRIYLLKLT